MSGSAPIDDPALIRDRCFLEYSPTDQRFNRCGVANRQGEVDWGVRVNLTDTDSGAEGGRVRVQVRVQVRVRVKVRVQVRVRVRL